MRKFFAKVFVVVLILCSVVSFSSTIVIAATEIDDEKLTLISERCYIIKDNINKTVQHNDSRSRAHLGDYYGAVLDNFITPLNLVLVKNNKTNINLAENQTNFVSERAKFASDYIKYQKDLEELLSIDCTVEPARFYNKLTIARENRAKVSADVAALNSLIDKQIKLVKNMKEGL